MTRLKLAVKPGAGGHLAEGELRLPRAYSGLLAGALGETIIFVDEPAGAGEAFAWGELQTLHATADRSEIIAAFNRIEEFETPFALPMTGDIEEVSELDWQLSLGKTGRLILVFPPLASGGFGENQQAGFDSTVDEMMLRSLYSMRCAVTGAPLINDQGVQQLEAVYLQPPSQGGEMTAGNAIVAQRLVASAIRRGYITFDDDYRIVVRRAPPVTLPPINDTGRLLLPADADSWPSREALRFHREHIALKSSAD